METGKKGEKTLHFGARLKYPIRITKLYKTPGDTIRRQEPVLQYSYEYTMELPQDRETLELQKKTLTSITDWNAPEDGKLLAWKVRVGDVVARDRACVTVEEACTHEIQFQGLCALCGKDMNEVNWASEQRDTDRAPINMTHDQTNLTVSHTAATRAELELQQRLLQQRKLSLVVDLDQTIIHACIDPTIGEWQQDASNPNYEALRDVQRFQLEEGHAGGVARGCFYYIKMRPGLREFLAAIAELYELHVYTMGTRTYATNIAKIVDPEQRLFGNRVISRDENGNIVAKSLQRLFPVSTNMAVIMDDRADVWPHNRHNLIKVSPYDFFKGTGDINSSFLPKRDDLPASSTPAAAAAASSTSAPASTSSTPTVAKDDKEVTASPASTAASTAVSGGSDSASDSASTAAASTPATSVANGGTPPANGSSSPASGDENTIDVVLLQKQTEEQERAIEKQIKDRPLLHMQEQLDKEDSEKAATTEATEDNSQATQTRHSAVLFDDDTELDFLKEHLTKLHHEFYEKYDEERGASTELIVDGIPDVGEILDKLKGEVLEGSTIVLSGLVPLGLDVERSEIGMQAKSFGARLQRQISRKVTHLVISSDRPRTQKVRQAARIPTTKIVNQNWLIDCFSQWAHVDETPYLVEIHPADRGQPGGGAGGAVGGTDTDTVSDADADPDDSDNDAGSATNGNPGLRINVPGRRRRAAGDGNTDTGDEGDDDDEFDEFNNSDGMSPIAELGKFDWGSADDELEMFLAEGDDEDDEDGDDDERDESEYGGDHDDGDNDVDMDRNENGDADANGSLLSTSSKRKHNGGGGNDTDTDSERATLRGRSLLAKRQKLASRSRSASQRRAAVALAASQGSGSGSGSGSESTHPLRQQTNISKEPAPTSAPAVASTSNDDDIDDDELEAMLMAELDKEEEEEAAGAGAVGAGSDDG
ncbi:CTD phosphatase Fcp1 [Sporothrix stenoceras]|uniref:RNA polymerase II subunit A C-terminal domain phosphatase n=1 Tax=Sporothrix stenoceras TaxID=5173 RepID=A0ABR3YJ93_9PEZI